MRVEVGGCSLYFSKDASVAFPQVLLVSLFFKLITRKNIFAAPLGEMKILIDKFLRFFSISFQFKLQSGEGNAKTRSNLARDKFHLEQKLFCLRFTWTLDGIQSRWLSFIGCANTGALGGDITKSLFSNIIRNLLPSHKVHIFSRELGFATFTQKKFRKAYWNSLQTLNERF